MRIRLGDLRKLIREFGVDDTLRHEAGFYMDGGGSGASEGGATAPPPGLGDPGECENELDASEHEKMSQSAVRVDDRQPRKR